MVDPQQALSRLNFGRVDGETDNRFESCFIGTEMLRQVLLPQHSLIVGNKGSGKSAIARLLTDSLQKVKPLLPKQYDQIYCVPAYGLQSEEYLPDVELAELRPESVDEFRYFWLLYLGLKTASILLQDTTMQGRIERAKDEKISDAVKLLRGVLVDVGLVEQKGFLSNFKKRFSGKKGNGKDSGEKKNGRPLASEFKQKTGVSIIALLDSIDLILRETNCLVWIMLDKLDLLFVDDIQKLRSSITGLVQLLVQYGNQFQNIHFKIFLRNDIYSQLHIVNKSHLISYSTEMRWRGPLLMKLLVSRAVVDPHVQAYCTEQLGEKADVTAVILGSDEFVEKLFYTIFEKSMNPGVAPDDPRAGSTHQWILKRLVDGMGNSFPRELIHLGNRAVDRQREIDRLEGKHASPRLISSRALRDAFESISLYRCDTYLYSEFPHLSKHFDVFRGSDSPVFHREELYLLFQPLSPNGDEAIRAVYDVGLLTPLGSNVDSSRKFSVPLLYRKGLGITDHRRTPPPPKHKDTSTPNRSSSPVEIPEEE